MKLRNENFDSEVEFVARYWRRDAFEPEQAMQRAGLVGGGRWSRMRGFLSEPRRMWTAAASAGVVLLAAAAGIYLGLNPAEPTVVETPQTVVEKTEHEAPQQPQRMQVKRIEFDNASLAEVTAAIEKTYGVTLGNVPADFEQRITMSYSGTADDVVETINELFGLHITIEDN